MKWRDVTQKDTWTVEMLMYAKAGAPRNAVAMRETEGEGGREGETVREQLVEALVFLFGLWQRGCNVSRF